MEGPRITVDAAAPALPEAQRKRRSAERVVARLRQAGFQAFFAGGCVRDLLLGKEPGDYDVATSAPAHQVQRLFPRTVGVGVQFGVVLVVEEGLGTQVATFRRDGIYLDHRHPLEVHFSDAEGDAQRRDFTINGMFLDPETGEVIDHVGGRADLAAKVVRAIGDPAERFAEDALRLMRAVRFAARLQYQIDPATRAAIERLAPTIREIAWERIGEEVIKILTEGGARRGFELLDQTGLLREVLPEVAALRGTAQSPDHHPEGDVFTHTMLCLEKLHPAHPETVALAVLLHDVAKPLCSTRDPDGRIRFNGHCERGAEMAEEICRRLRRSRETSESVAWLIRKHLYHVQARRMRLATLKRFLGEPLIEELLEVVRIDALSASGDLDAWAYCVRRRAELSAAGVRPEPLLRGRDLIELGYRPGPDFKRILDAAFDAQLEGELHSTEEARSWVLERHPPSATPASP